MYIPPREAMLGVHTLREAYMEVYTPQGGIYGRFTPLREAREEAYTTLREAREEAYTTLGM